MKRSIKVLGILGLALLGLLLSQPAWAQDTDLDGIPNSIEAGHACLNPNNQDTDGDGLCDDTNTRPGCSGGAVGEDLNRNGVVDPGETSPCLADTDGDGLDDKQEKMIYFTDPLDPDSDDDGLSDNAEVITSGTDPWNPDTDFDGLNDAVEALISCADPLDPDTDDDGLLDGQEDVNHNGMPDPGETSPCDGSHPVVTALTFPATATITDTITITAHLVDKNGDLPDCIQIHGLMTMSSTLGGTTVIDLDKYASIAQIIMCDDGINQGDAVAHDGTYTIQKNLLAALGIVYEDIPPEFLVFLSEVQLDFVGWVFDNAGHQSNLTTASSYFYNDRPVIYNLVYPAQASPEDVITLSADIVDHNGDLPACVRFHGLISSPTYPELGVIDVDDYASIAEIYLCDDGLNGDLAAGDGTYSLQKNLGEMIANYLPAEYLPFLKEFDLVVSTWVFDQAGNQSNTVTAMTHFVSHAPIIYNLALDPASATLGDTVMISAVFDDLEGLADIRYPEWPGTTCVWLHGTLDSPAGEINLDDFQALFKVFLCDNGRDGDAVAGDGLWSTELNIGQQVLQAMPPEYLPYFTDFDFTLNAWIVDHEGNPSNIAAANAHFINHNPILYDWVAPATIETGTPTVVASTMHIYDVDGTRTDIYHDVTGTHGCTYFWGELTVDEIPGVTFELEDFFSAFKVWFCDDGVAPDAVANDGIYTKGGVLDATMLQTLFNNLPPEYLQYGAIPLHTRLTLWLFDKEGNKSNEITAVTQLINHSPVISDQQYPAEVETNQVIQVSAKIEDLDGDLDVPIQMHGALTAHSTLNQWPDQVIDLDDPLIAPYVQFFLEFDAGNDRYVHTLDLGAELFNYLPPEFLPYFDDFTIALDWYVLDQAGHESNHAMVSAHFVNRAPIITEVAYPLTISPTDPFWITARISDVDGVIGDLTNCALIHGTIMAPDLLPGESLSLDALYALDPSAKSYLCDRGIAPDPAAGDGIYSVTFSLWNAIVQHLPPEALEHLAATTDIVVNAWVFDLAGHRSNIVTQQSTFTYDGDYDDDGLPDWIELAAESCTDAENPDTDGDGLNDGVEDADQDGACDNCNLPGGETDPCGSNPVVSTPLIPPSIDPHTIVNLRATITDADGNLPVCILVHGLLTADGVPGSINLDDIYASQGSGSYAWLCDNGNFNDGAAGDGQYGMDFDLWNSIFQYLPAQYFDELHPTNLHMTAWVFDPEGNISNQPTATTFFDYDGDYDHDGIPDSVEVGHSCLSATNPDTDGDGLNDGVEDADQDGVVDAGETNPCAASPVISACTYPATISFPTQNILDLSCLIVDADGNDPAQGIPTPCISFQGCLTALDPNTHEVLASLCTDPGGGSGIPGLELTACDDGDLSDGDAVAGDGRYSNRIDLWANIKALLPPQYLQYLHDADLQIQLFVVDNAGNQSNQVGASIEFLYDGDYDDDGVMDWVELAPGQCMNEENPDTDGDGLNDGVEDADQDGVVDPGETNPCGANPVISACTYPATISFPTQNILDLSCLIVDADGNDPAQGIPTPCISFQGCLTALDPNTHEVLASLCTDPGGGSGIPGLELTACDDGDLSDGDAVAGDSRYSNRIDLWANIKALLPPEYLQYLHDADLQIQLFVVDNAGNQSNQVGASIEFLYDGDYDDDGVMDWVELAPGQCMNEENPDTDGDGLNDGVEDADQDGVVDATETNPCLADTDGDSSNDNVDCKPLDASIYPGAAEICDGIDNDCDTVIDEGVKLSFYLDGDDDTYGLLTGATLACAAPTGYVANSADCDDTDPLINPLATEVCDGEDNDCDSQIDEGVKLSFYLDGDGDLYGLLTGATLACAAPTGYVADNTDCNDASNVIYPFAPEACDTIDNQCPGNPGYGQTDEGCGMSPWDADGDALPDTYELAHAGDSPPLDYQNALDGFADFDGDGNSNRNEYWNGSNPWASQPVGAAGCNYWADAGLGDRIVSPTDAIELKKVMTGGVGNYTGVIPNNGETHELDMDGYISPLDLVILQRMIQEGAIGILPSRPNALVTAYAAPTVSVGFTTHVTMRVRNDANKGTPGIGVIFEIVPAASTATATLLGGDGNGGGSSRYDISGPITPGGLANIVIRMDTAGTLTLRARIPACGLPGIGRSCSEIVSPDVVIIGMP